MLGQLETTILKSTECQSYDEFLSLSSAMLVFTLAQPQITAYPSCLPTLLDGNSFQNKDLIDERGRGLP